jgi:hypothetical protein
VRLIVLRDSDEVVAVHEIRNQGDHSDQHFCRRGHRRVDVTA